MPFPAKVAETALLDSGRFCCLCHKFCGSKMELHHIVAIADGGQDTFDNCIPLCFDCHADVRAYDPKHPKGRKYTEAELRGHRDRWYTKIKRTNEMSTSPEYLSIDRELFQQIREILPSEGSISLVRENDYFGPFMRSDHDDLHVFVRKCKNPETEFLDADLENLRSRLQTEIYNFLSIIGQRTFVHKVLHEYNQITIVNSDLLEYIADRTNDPNEGERLLQEAKERSLEVGNKLNDLADRICDTYDSLIRLGRRKLAV